MTIEVEDGTGKASAVSYASEAEATAYFAARGVDAWADVGDATAQEASLVRATAALDSWLRGRWLGVKKTQAQALAWPRTDVVDEEGFEVLDTIVPVQVKQATYEIALVEVQGTSFIQQSVNSSNMVSSETVGPISVAYRNDAPSITTYPHIEALIRGLAAVGGAQVNFSVSLTQAEIDAQSGSTDVFDYDEYFNLIKGY